MRLVVQEVVEKSHKMEGAAEENGAGSAVVTPMPSSHLNIAVDDLPEQG